jgi:hypothetical protein
MFRYIKLALGAIAVWAIFTVTGLVAGMQVVVCLLACRFRQAGNIFRAMDCLAAAQIGYDGRKTVSKECGMQHKKSSFCRKLCPMLDWADDGHCEREGKE